MLKKLFKKKPFKYIDLPIYSVHRQSIQVVSYKSILIFSGGGGHGISNQIVRVP